MEEPNGSEQPEPAGRSSQWVAPSGCEQPEALGRALEAERRYLRLVARQMLPPELTGVMDASDLVQKTFVNVLKSGANFRGQSRAQWRSWLTVILLRELAKERAKRGRLRVVAVRDLDATEPGHDPRDVADSRPTPGRRAQRNEQILALLEAVRGLPKPERQIVLRRYVDGQTYEQIGTKTGLSESGAKKALGRVLQDLKAKLGPGHEPSS